MTGKEKILIGFAFLTPLLSASYFYSEINRTPATITQLCNASAYQTEKMEVQRLVRERIDAIKAGENLPLLLPVEFIFTTGDRQDSSSYLSHLRSIMRVNDDGETLIQTSDKSLSYLTDHRFARKEFISGRRKYFSVVEVKRIKMAFPPENAESQFRNVLHDYVSHFELTGELNIAHLILADIRNPIAPHLKDVPFMKVLKKKDEMIETFGKDRIVDGVKYSAYEGMPKMIDRFSCETFSSILTTSFRISKGRELHAEILNEP